MLGFRTPPHTVGQPSSWKPMCLLPPPGGGGSEDGERVRPVRRPRPTGLVIRRPVGQGHYAKVPYWGGGGRVFHKEFRKARLWGRLARNHTEHLASSSFIYLHSYLHVPS